LSIDDPRIRVYVVWEAIHPPDTEQSATAASGLLADSRVVQLWSSKRFTSNAFQEALGLKQSLPWDVVLVFAPEARWADPAHGPVPTDFMHNFRDEEEKLPENKRLNGQRLAEEVVDLLKGGPRKPEKFN
jgi:hypothetical protein